MDEIVLKCARCGSELNMFTNTATDGVVYVTADPCQTCCTRKFNDGQDFARRMDERERDRCR